MQRDCTMNEKAVLDLRGAFPALSRQWNGREVVYFDGPGGTQVPQTVIDAIADYLSRSNANLGGPFVTSVETEALLQRTLAAVADLLGCRDPACVHFGPNMTTLVMCFSRALGRTWRAGDQIIVSRLDHDANFTPWVLAARDAGVTVRMLDVNPLDCTLDIDQFRRELTDRTRLVAVGGASNAVGTINPIQEICRLARTVGALTFIDAVHLAPHRLIDVEQIGCDFLACSAYKFFGPHQGIMWGRRELLESIVPYKLRPSPNDLPGRWMTGTQNHECWAGIVAAVEYLAGIGRRLASDSQLDRRGALEIAYSAIQAYEQDLGRHLLRGLHELPAVRLWGIGDESRLADRTATFAITHQLRSPQELASRLAEHGIFTWAGNYYALPLTEALGLEPDGMLRIGLMHYNTRDEVDRLLAVLRTLC